MTYSQAIRSTGNSCDLLIWDRECAGLSKDRDYGDRVYAYSRQLDNSSSKTDKLMGYIGATAYFRRILKSNQYDGVVFLQSHAAIACSDVAVRHYKHRYIVDVRDYTLEGSRLYRELESFVFKNAYRVVISSPAYRSFLPECDYVLAHNYTPFSEDEIKAVRNANQQKEEQIAISFVGTIRFLDINKQLMKLFSQDSRFRLNYYGRGAEGLQKFSEANSITNTAFHGSFPFDETYTFYIGTDLINNLYGNHNKYLDYALSNKLYHAVQLRIPILVMPDTYMAQIIDQYKVGYVFDCDAIDCVEKLYKWYTNLDRKEFELGCIEFVNKVQQENLAYQNMIRDFILTSTSTNRG